MQCAPKLVARLPRPQLAGRKEPLYVQLFAGMSELTIIEETLSSEKVEKLAPSNKRIARNMDEISALRASIGTLRLSIEDLLAQFA